MKIASANLEMKSSHFALEKREINERRRMWAGERPDFAGRQRAAARPQTPSAADVSLSARGRQKSAEARAIDSAQQSVANDPTMNLLKTMLFHMFGIDIDVFDASEIEPAAGTEQPNPAPIPMPAAAPSPASGDAPPPAGFGLEYDYRALRTEIETLHFAAEGVVQTADGQSFSFKVSLEMTRSFSERIDLSLRLGDAARQKDPLVINFAGNAATLSDQTFRIDLDRDGEEDEAHFLAPGSGFLVFDRNTNGRIDSARELFGPSSGDGFAELAALDTDRNGWIDENDADYERLQVWSRDPAGKDQLQTLQAAKVGALSLARLATPFSLKDGGNALLGQVKSSGVYLSDDGHAGTLQQIDLAV